MRRLRQLDQYRIQHKRGYAGDDAGAFEIPNPFKGPILRVIATTGEGWDHVSVSTAIRIPTWEEMDHIKRLFFEPNEWAMQLHPPPSEYINVHPHTLHLWRPLNHKIPIPPRDFV